MDLVTRIRDLIEPALNEMGLTTVEVLLAGRGRLKLEITIERQDETPLSMEECVKANREISTLLDVEDPIDRSYVLEVSSPGLERPLVQPKDFKRFVGEKIKVKVHEFVGERKKFTGILKSAHDEGVVIIVDDQEISLAYDEIQRAKLSPDLQFKA
jgi:Uncharacterized protein conserved in bacteria